MYLADSFFWKSRAHFMMMVIFSIKPGDQTGDTENPKLVNKTGPVKGQYQSFSFCKTFPD